MGRQKKAKCKICDNGDDLICFRNEQICKDCVDYIRGDL